MEQFYLPGNPGKMFPSVFFSRNLTTAERNYDVDNKERLSIKAALAEWRHWLEGACHPFQVITDHKNLEYIRCAKHLNPRQTHLSLFFTSFQFTVTYIREARIVKLMTFREDMIQMKPPAAKGQFYLTSVIVAPIRWDIMEKLHREQQTEPTPPECPPARHYVPRSLRQQMMQWVHTSLSSGYPGIHQTIELLRKSI